MKLASVLLVIVGAAGAARPRVREARSASLCVAAGAFAGAHRLSGCLTKTIIPGSVAYRPIASPLLSPPQRIVIAACVAYGCRGLGEELALQHTRVGASLRSLGRAPLSLADALRDRLDEARQKRREAERQAWLREHTGAARIY